MLYRLVVFLHVLCVLGYLLVHGISAGVSFALQKERDINRIRTLLDLSSTSYPWMFRLMWAFLIFGFIATFMGGWQIRIWPWLSLVLGFLIFLGMALFGANHYGAARKVLGMRYNVQGKWYPPEPAGNSEEAFTFLAKSNPVLLTVIGYGGFAIITWLMTAKPF